jgi:hypothetical protein
VRASRGSIRVRRCSVRTRPARVVRTHYSGARHLPRSSPWDRENSMFLTVPSACARALAQRDHCSRICRHLPAPVPRHHPPSLGGNGLPIKEPCRRSTGISPRSNDVHTHHVHRPSSLPRGLPAHLPRSTSCRITSRALSSDLRSLLLHTTTVQRNGLLVQQLRLRALAKLDQLGGRAKETIFRRQKDAQDQ